VRLKSRHDIIMFLTILGVQAPFWWIKDAATLVWPELDAGGTADALATLALGVSAVTAGLLTWYRPVEPTLVPDDGNGADPEEPAPPVS
jgi:hypothetical protein